MVLPFRDTEYFPLGYDRPAGMSFLGDKWKKQPPRWHAVAWALRRPWQADAKIGPTFNAAVNGAVYWDHYAAQDEQTDRFARRFGPAEVSHKRTEAMDLTPMLTSDAFGETLADRLRQFADCGVMVRKWELYDARYWRGGYEWATGTGQRGVLIHAPKLRVTFKPGDAAVGELDEPADVASIAQGPTRGKPTAVVPDRKAFQALAEKLAFDRPDYMSDWQWRRAQELREMGGGEGFPESYEDYLAWIDKFLSLYPRAWKGFTAGEMAVEYAMYREAMPAPAVDNLKRYWRAWLMPDRDYDELVHGYVGGKAGGEAAQQYYEKTGDWRGNFSVYRTYLHNMGTVNFNSWAITGAMFGGWIIGDENIMAEARRGYDRFMTRTWTWPDGSHTFTDYLDSDGVGGPRTRIQVTLTVAGDTLTADFTGSAPQVRGALNSTLSFTASVVGLCVRAVLQEDIPNTAGMFRPLNIIAPPGTVVNVEMPGASSMRGVTGFRMADTVFGALAGLLPERVLAAGEGGNTLVIIGGQRQDRSAYVYYELLSGTWGARPDRDGNDGLCNPANVASNIPVEQAEAEYPVRVERYGLVRDSGGAGKFRGGLAIEREWRLLSGEAHLAIRSDRRDHLPYGLYGGQSGTPSTNILHAAAGDGQDILPTMISTTMNAGQRIYHKQAGGGGWGDPLLRDPAAVALDVKNDKVSATAAREQYGVVLNQTTLAVDEAATTALRRQLQNGQNA